MAISLTTAKDTVTRLRTMSGSEMFNALAQAGNHLFSTHLTKANALEAARTKHRPQGYFKKVEKVRVEDLRTYKALSTRDQKHTAVRKPPRATDFGRGKEVMMTRKSSGSEVVIDILGRVFGGRTDGEYYLSHDNQDTRFLYVTGIPDGYIGRSVEVTEGEDDDDETITKDKNLFKVAAVVDTSGVRPFILTIYPVTQLYVDQQRALT